ncbi:hypothetical protein DRN77_02845 [Methanosarcinales archaeon]|nr:MAG: hypothetical protein DRN77_02845 [Methanosarcinales archaeon]
MKSFMGVESCNSIMKMAIKLLVILLLLTSLCSADRGMISFPESVRIEESGQNAIVAWNGNEEVIILSTDVKSSEPATILEVITLPSNPVSVEEGSFDSFMNITEIINRKSKDIAGKKKSLGVGRDTGPGIEITFHKRIGAHDVTIVKVNDVDCFIDWIKDFTEREGFEYTELSSRFRNGVTGCIDRNITYFVFDVIRIGEDEETVKPLVYRFESDYLYYPLEITAISDAGSSYADVNVFLITEGMINERAVRDAKLWARAGFRYGIQLNKQELEDISPEIGDMFESDPFVMNAYSHGRLDMLDEDLVVHRDDIHVPTLLDKISQRISIFLSPSWAFIFLFGASEEIFDDNPEWTDVFIAIILLSFIAGIPSAIYIMVRMIKRSLRKHGFESLDVVSYVIPIVVTAFLLLSDDIFAMYAIFVFIFIGFSMTIFLITRLIKHAI